MKVMIDMPEETYNKMRRGEALYSADANVAIFAIETGTPLSESEDCVSRQAVLDLAKFDGRENLGSIIHAFDVEQLPPVNPAEKKEPCEDCISRKEVIKLMEWGWKKGIFPIFQIIALPSVTPAEKVGHWIKIDDCSNSGYYCSECRKRVVKEGWSDTVKIIKYCPNCGVKMVEPQESEG